MTTFLGILALAVLFAAFGLLRPGDACEGHCDSCASGTCPFVESDHVQR